jgi:hypothetical protein
LDDDRARREMSGLRVAVGVLDTDLAVGLAGIVDDDDDIGEGLFRGELNRDGFIVRAIVMARPPDREVARDVVGAVLAGLITPEPGVPALGDLGERGYFRTGTVAAVEPALKSFGAGVQS